MYAQEFARFVAAASIAAAVLYVPPSVPRSYIVPSAYRNACVSPSAVVDWPTTSPEALTPYASLVTYLVPPIALAYGAIFLGERFGIYAFVGLALILGGVALATGSVRVASLRSGRGTELQLDSRRG